MSIDKTLARASLHPRRDTVPGKRSDSQRLT